MTRAKYTKGGRKYPPYARQLALPESNLTIFIGCGGHGWERAKQLAGRSLVLPVGDDPRAYRWPVRGCGAILLDYSGDDSTAGLLADELMRAGARCVIRCDFCASNAELLRGDWRIC